MKERLFRTSRYLKKLLFLEITTSYSFPMIIGFFGIICILTGLSAMNIGFVPLLFGWDSEEPFNGVEDVQRYLGDFSFRRGLILSESFTYSLLALSFLIPLIIAFNLSRMLEDGTMRTILSYPVERTRYLTIKISLVTTLLYILVLSSTIFWMYFWYPLGIGVDNMTLLLASSFVTLLMIVSSTTFLAVLTKNMFRTAIIGASFWGSISYLIETTTDAVPFVIVQLVSPFRVLKIYLAGYIMDINLIDVYLSLAGSVFISLVFMLLAVIIFRRTEV